MSNTETISRERLEEIRYCNWMDDLGLSMAEVNEMARRLLEGMDNEPVAFIAYYDSGLRVGVCDVDDTVKMEWLKRGLNIKALYTAPRLPAGEVVITKNEHGNIVAVTRQDDDGRVLEVIAESDTSTPVAVPEMTDAMALDFIKDRYLFDDVLRATKLAWNACRAAMNK